MIFPPYLGFGSGTEWIKGFTGYFVADIGLVIITLLALAKQKLGERYVLQGNLEPCRIYAKAEMLQGAKEILALMQGSAHIFNLGHGMLPDLPRKNVIALVEFIQNYKHV